VREQHKEVRGTVGFFYDLLLDHVSDRWNNDAIQTVLNSLRAMLDLHQETARGHSATLSGLPGQGQTGSFVEALGTLPPLLNQNAQTGYDIQAEAEQVAERAWESTTEAAVEADTELEADAAVSTFVDTFTGPVGWLITTLIEIGIGAFIIYEFIQTVEDIVRDFERLFPTAAPQQQPVSPPAGTSTATPGSTPTNSLTQAQQELAERLYQEAQNEGLSITLSDIEEMIARNPGLTDYQYGLLMRLWARGIQAFDVVDIGQNVDGKTVWLDQAQLGHILQKHDQEFNGLTDEEIIGLIMTTLLYEQPSRVVDDAYYYDYVDINGTEETLVIVVNSEGRVISAFPERPLSP
jgi:hypothetical protein